MDVGGRCWERSVRYKDPIHVRVGDVLLPRDQDASRVTREPHGTFLRTWCRDRRIIRRRFDPSAVLALHVVPIRRELLQVHAGGHQAESSVVLGSQRLVGSEGLGRVLPEVRGKRQAAF